jgi:hypothetical protein
MYSANPVIQAGESGNDLIGDAKCDLTIAPKNLDAMAGAIM